MRPVVSSIVRAGEPPVRRASEMATLEWDLHETLRAEENFQRVGKLVILVLLL